MPRSAGDGVAGQVRETEDEAGLTAGQPHCHDLRAEGASDGPDVYICLHSVYSYEQ